MTIEKREMNTVQSVLVEYEDKKGENVYANSGFFFGDRYVLITSNILMPLLDEKMSRVRSLETGRFLNPEVLLELLPEVNVVVTTTQYKRGVLCAMFVNENLKRTCEKILSDWTVDYQEDDHQFKDLLSLFFIVEIAPPKMDREDLLRCLQKIWSDAQNLQVEVGQKIGVESVPFGNRHFLKSHSRGIISNVSGCLILTDASTAPGSEGGPIFLSIKQHPQHMEKNTVAIGIVISSLCWWKGEWTGLTLGANISSLLEPLITFKENPKAENLLSVKASVIAEVAERSLVRVTSGMSWGTAIFLTKNVFITNSHVIEGDGVFLHWKTKGIPATVVFRTNPEDAYDLAIITGNERSLEATGLKPVEVSLDQLRIGERVFAAGFPLFERHQNPRPTLTSGHVSHVSPSMIRTTCSVLPGSSGGAILRPNGSLVGVIVCNTKLQDANSPAYPRVNLSIPIGAVYEIMTEFVKTEDVSVLLKLQVQDSCVNKQWNLLNCKL